jgi:hypothetical protein
MNRSEKLDFFSASLSALLVARKKMEIHFDHQKSS